MDKTNKTYLHLKKESIRLKNEFFNASSNGQLTSDQLHSLREIFGSLRQLEIVLKRNEKWDNFSKRTHQRATQLVKEHRSEFIQAIQKHTGRIPE